MSITAVAWALRTRVGDSRAKMVLLMLANNADENDGNQFPPLRRFADLVECSARTARSKLKKLEATGLICRHCWYRP
ncbi:MAG: helix-turn-helix domain-containing protein [Methyloceanibacter sp.]|nr:helix-turn-helix domain-containing protein [Methyloceanibacter sp.]